MHNRRPLSQLQRISLSLSNFHEITKYERRYGKTSVVTFFSLATCLLAFFYYIYKLDLNNICAEKLSPFISTSRGRRAHGLITVCAENSILFISMFGFFFMGVASFAFFQYAYNHICDKSLQDPEINLFSEMIISHPKYKQEKGIALQELDAVGVKISNPNDPYQILAGLKKVERILRQKMEQRFAFISLGYRNSSSTLFRGLGGGKNQATQEIYKNIFEFAGMKSLK